MSASQIPNLLRARGPGSSSRRNLPTLGTKKTPQEKRDLDVQGTDFDAAVSRLSAVSVGYLTDPFASFFVPTTVNRRLPLINRGTYMRTTAIDLLIRKFLASTEAHQVKQIISLGAGTDTRYFRLREQKLHLNVVYHEFDFPAVSEAKRKTVTQNPIFLPHPDSGQVWLQPPAEGDQLEPKEWGFSRQEKDSVEVIYCFHPVDLRKFTASNFRTSFTGYRTDVPTLILSECCLCYMDIDESIRAVQWFTKNLTSAGIIIYEPLGIKDSFGHMMIKNLALRNIVMPSLDYYRSLMDQKARLSELGFPCLGPQDGCEAETIENLWENWIPLDEKARLDQMETLDEVEEWQMLARHYAIAWAWKSTNGGWDEWRRMRDQTPQGS